MPTKLYNTLGHEKEFFEPMDGKLVKMYSCGPTVYDHAHIGNFSAHIFADALIRSLKKVGGWKVKWAVNITDVGHLTEDDVGMGDQGEDKLEKGARRDGKTPQEIVQFYTDSFLNDWKLLRITEPDARPKASEFIPQIIEFVKDLEEKGVAYETSDGVYFEIDKFPGYGKLSGNKLENLKAGARVEVNEDKKSPFDFALWKKAVGPHEKALQTWDSPWGKGFPGWHVECSVMAEDIMGRKKGQPILDIHTSAEDHIFPHHECEIAQTGARHPETEKEVGCTLARFWMHRKHLLVDGKKMSKSKGNFYRVSDVIEQGFDPLDFRYLILSAHYRTQQNFTWEALWAAKTARGKIVDFWRRLEKFEPYQKIEFESDFPIFHMDEFVKALKDDLNTSKALADFHDAMREANTMMDKEMMTMEQKVHMEEFVGLFDAIWDIFPGGEESIPDKVRKLAEERELVRKDEDWDKSDHLRKQIDELGWDIQDVKGGYELKKK